MGNERERKVLRWLSGKGAAPFKGDPDAVAGKRLMETH